MLRLEAELEESHPRKGDGQCKVLRWGGLVGLQPGE